MSCLADMEAPAETCGDLQRPTGAVDGNRVGWVIYLEIYFSGSRNSSGVGWNSGHGGQM